jgi:hypothetical protein
MAKVYFNPMAEVPARDYVHSGNGDEMKRTFCPSAADTSGHAMEKSNRHAPDRLFRGDWADRVSPLSLWITI